MRSGPLTQKPMRNVFGNAVDNEFKLRVAPFEVNRQADQR